MTVLVVLISKRSEDVELVQTEFSRGDLMLVSVTGQTVVETVNVVRKVELARQLSTVELRLMVV